MMPTEWNKQIPWGKLKHDDVRVKIQTARFNVLWNGRPRQAPASELQRYELLNDLLL
jgi:hypothetical protein